MAFEKGTHLLGIKYWAQWYHLTAPPKYEVFIYIGKDIERGIFYFRSKKSNAILTKGFYQLDAYGFKAFCLDMASIKNYIEGVQNVPPISS